MLWSDAPSQTLVESAAAGFGTTVARNLFAPVEFSGTPTYAVIADALAFSDFLASAKNGGPPQLENVATPTSDANAATESLTSAATPPPQIEWSGGMWAAASVSQPRQAQATEEQ
jgi:hypothetical protein